MSNLKLEAQITKAHVAGIAASIFEPRAKDAYYDRETGEIVVQMRNGAKFSFPHQLGQGLQGASADELAEVEVTPSGEGLHWETLDVDFSIPALIKGIFGTSSWMAELGRSGGTEPHPELQFGDSGQELGTAFRPEPKGTAIWLNFPDLKGNCSAGEPGHGLSDSLTRFAV